MRKKETFSKNPNFVIFLYFQQKFGGFLDVILLGKKIIAQCAPYKRDPGHAHDIVWSAVRSTLTLDSNDLRSVPTGNTSNLRKGKRTNGGHVPIPGQTVC